MGNIKRFVGMNYHRNGVGGYGAVVTIFESAETGRMVATSIDPPTYGAESKAEAPRRPSQYAIQRLGFKEAYIEAYLDAFARSTVVVTVEQVNEGDTKTAWRGADYYGPEIAREWRRRCMESLIWPGQPGHDPALEQFHEDMPHVTFPLPRPEGYAPTEQESADIKAFLDRADDVEQFVVRENYPLESNEWAEEREKALR